MPIATNFGIPDPPRAIEQLHAHDEVVVEELGRALAIGADAADDRRQMDDDRRPDGLVQPLDVARAAAGRTRRCAER